MNPPLKEEAAPVRASVILAVAGAIVAILLHLLFAWNAGALWRDEVNTLDVATMRTLPELWANLSFDSFPALYFIILRFLGLTSDPALRIFGAGIGLLILAALWLNARWLRLGVPLITLALIGFNPIVIRYGDSIRAYGLGILLVLLVVGAVWRLLESFTPRRAILAATIAVLSVQSVYANSVLLFAICLGACAVTLRRRAFKQTFVILGIGFIAALSLLPYLPTMRRVQACSFMWKRPCTFLDIWTQGTATLGGSVPQGVWLWLLLVVLALMFGGSVLWRKRGALAENERLLFGFVTLVVGAVGYVGFLRALSYAMQPWYYVAFVAFAATSIEIIFSAIGATRRMLLARSACALLLMGLGIWPALSALEARQTNIDLIASRLQTAVEPGDLIVLNAWNYGITFQRYYQGAATCETIPPIEDLRVHRVDLAKRQMMLPAPLAPVLQRIEETLRAGKTVWLVGGLKLVAPGKAPLQLPPAADGPAGWVSGDFYAAWSEQVSALTRRHALSFQPVQFDRDQPVAAFEKVSLSQFRGWRDEADDSQAGYF